MEGRQGGLREGMRGQRVPPPPPPPPWFSAATSGLQGSDRDVTAT